MLCRFTTAPCSAVWDETDDALAYVYLDICFPLSQLLVLGDLYLFLQFCERDKVTFSMQKGVISMRKKMSCRM